MRPSSSASGQLDGPDQGRPPTRANRKIGLLVVVVVLAVVVLVGGALFLVRGDEERSPEATIRAFQEASATNDCEAAADLTTVESWALIMAAADGTTQVPVSPSRAEVIRSCREHSGDNIDETLDNVEVISVESDRAVVAVTVTSDGDTSTYQFVLVREDGTWKLDFAASANPAPST